jgi:cell division transport system ATP-binding protein
VAEEWGRVIRLSNLRKEYPGGRVALDGVSLDVEAGEFVLLTGSSGSGKSVLIRVLSGTEYSTEGQGVVAGRNLARLDTPSLAALRRQIGVVYQDARLIDRLSVVDNVALAAEVVGEPVASAHEHAIAVLERVGLRELADWPAVALSAGDRQRACLARALVHRPALLLCDEPTGHLDPDATEHLIGLLKQVHCSGTTVFVATHDEEALALLDCRTLMMYRGRVFEEDDVRLASSQ